MSDGDDGRCFFKLEMASNASNDQSRVELLLSSWEPFSPLPFSNGTKYHRSVIAFLIDIMSLTFIGLYMGPPRLNIYTVFIG